MSKNAYDLLMETANRAGWNTDSKLRVMCDFIDELEETLSLDMGHWDVTILQGFKDFLQERLKQEKKFGHLFTPQK